MKESLISHRTKKAFNRTTKINRKNASKCLNTFQTNEEKLFGNKSFLEIILGLIKRTQSNLLNNKLKSDVSDFSIIKQILIELKNDLNEIKKEKEKKFDLLQMIRNDNYKSIKDIVFNNTKSKVPIIDYDTNNFDLNNIESLIFERDDEEYKKEVSQLKCLNFKMENEIKKVENLTNRMIFEKDYVKMSHIVNDFKTDTIYIKQSDDETINELLHDKLIHRRKTFIKKANMKNNQDSYINYIMGKIIECKKDLKDSYNNYNFNIISEEDKSYIETIYENSLINHKNDETSINNNSLRFDNIVINNKPDINTKLIKDGLNIINEKNNISHKESTNNDDTCCNSSEKNPVEIQNES